MNRLLWFLLLFAFSTPVNADELRPGYMEFTQQTTTRWLVVWKMPMQGGFTPSTAPNLPKVCGLKGLPQRNITNAAVTTHAGGRLSSLPRKGEARIAAVGRRTSGAVQLTSWREPPRTGLFHSARLLSPDALRAAS